MDERTPPTRQSRASEAGFSLLEGLIAAALLLFILIGVLPLFERSRQNLQQGNDASNVANATIDGNDRLLSIEFNSQITNLPAAATQVTATDFWLLQGDRWVTDMTAFPNDRAQFTRTTTIDQFGVRDMTDNGVLDTPLQGDALPGDVQLKRIQTDIVNARTVGSGAGATFHVVVIRAF